MTKKKNNEIYSLVFKFSIVVLLYVGWVWQPISLLRNCERYTSDVCCFSSERSKVLSFPMKLFFFATAAPACHCCRKPCSTTPALHCCMAVWLGKHVPMHC